MNLDRLIIFIKSRTLELKELLLNIKVTNKFSNEIEIHVYENLKKIKDVKPHFIVLDVESSCITKNDIDYINKNYRYLKDKIIVSINKEERESLSSIINLGIGEFIFKPYIEEEVTLRFKNYINYFTALNLSRNKEIQFNALLNNTPYMAWFKDKDSNYIMANDDFKIHSGKGMSEIFGRDDKFVWDGKIGESCRVYDLEVMKTRKQKVFDEVIPGKKGYREFNIHKAPVIDEFDNVIGTIGVARDITEIKNKDNQLRIMIENLPFIVVLKDIHGIVLEVSSNIVDYCGITREEIIGRDARHLENVKIPEKFFDIDYIQDKEVIRHRKSLEFIRRVNWNSKDYIIKIYKVPILDIENKVSGIVTLLEDITEESQIQDKIKELAFTDFLTGVKNRRALYEYLDEKINENSGLTIGFIDLDNFKKLNDIYGHNSGDEILKLFAKKLSEVCIGAIISRIGGDEFVIVWPKIIENYLLKIKIDNILEEVKMLFYKYDKTNLLSVSIGVVVDKGNGNTIEGLMGKGDFALYKAKEQGKNRYVFYNEKLKEENIFNINMESDIVNLIKNDEIILCYQPQFTCNKELKGVEALFRWNNPKYRDIPAYKIIRAIENAGVMTEVGDAILEKAFIFANIINKNRKDPIKISINISPTQIMNDNFVYRVKKIINKTKVKTNNIIFEITESILLDNIDKNIKKLFELRSLGIYIALDDFGTGYSSLNYLVKLPINELKIDRSFIIGFSSDNYVKLIKHITDIAHDLNLSVVAEGVEENWQLDILRNIGIDYIQGYIFGKPMGEEEVLKLIKS